MALQRNKLTARAVATITKPGRHSDGGNLYLNVTPTGARSWVFMYRFRGRQREMGLGSILDVPLARARDLAADAKREIKEGRDPLAARTKITLRTFGECADDYIERMKPQWSNAKHLWQWTTTLTEHAAQLRPVPIQDVDGAAVLDVLRPIWSKTPETASRLRGRIEAVLDAAKAQGLRSGENPARWRGHLDQLLPKRQKLSRGHHKALSIDAVPTFMVSIRGREGISARALEFTILTAARTSEAIGAKWEEMDLDRAVWTVPASRMKAKREHRVPLSSPALAILKDLRAAELDGFVFPGMKANTPISNMSMDKVLRLERLDVTVHGFRSTFRDWASERTTFPHEICEMALAHTIKDEAEAAYRRGDLLERRRELMEAWAGFCVSSGSSQSGAPQLRVVGGAPHVQR